MRAIRLLRLASALAFASTLSMPLATIAEEAPGANAAPTAKAPKSNATTDRREGVDAETLYAALVHIESVAVPNARSIASVGREREGTGTVISADGLILTIGYLVIEADSIKVTDNQGRVYPARLAAYDPATGLALLRTSVPMKITPVPLGNSAKLATREPVLIAGWGGVPDTALAYVVSKRPFTGNWEYMLDEAIYTSPPTTGWSGAALVDRKGTIVGVGSLVVRDATTEEPQLPGNMFVPIDALKPILDDMVKTGRRKEAPRPWLGVAADEIAGRLIVTRVSPESPADAAGLKTGDIILGVGNDVVRSQAEFYRALWGRGHAGDVIRLRVLQGLDMREVEVRSIDRVDYYRPATMD